MSSVPTGRRPETSDPAILAEDVSKRYRARAPASTGRGIRLWQRGDGEAAADEDDDDVVGDDDETVETATARAQSETWALRDISFEVPRGGSLAVVGPTGSGKTTLLKILARITIPTEGRVVLRGRVAPIIGSLQAFLQRDTDAKANVRLLASLFGFPPKVPEGEFRSILDFAEIASLGKTRLAGYSGGQQARLAYSTFLHLPSDILVVDGSILPGDAEFSERCLEHIEDRVAAGAALVIAPHDLEIANRLCAEAIWLKAGRLQSRGPTHGVVATVRREVSEARQERAERRAARASKRTEARLAVIGVGIYGEDGYPIETIDPSQAALLHIRFEAPHGDAAVLCGLALTRADGTDVRVVQEEAVNLGGSGAFLGSVTLPPGCLAPGTYFGRAKVFTFQGGEKTASGTSERLGFTVTRRTNGISPDGVTSDEQAEGSRVIEGSWIFVPQGEAAPNQH